jgi:hypothetical protein
VTLTNPVRGVRLPRGGRVSFLSENPEPDMFCQEASKAIVREDLADRKQRSEDSTEEVNCQSSFLRSREKSAN